MPLTLQSDLPFFTQFKKSLQVSIVIQATFLFASALILDGGDSLQFFMVTAVAYWCAVAIIMVRRNATTWDKILLAWGYPLMLPMTAALLALEPFGWFRK